MAVRLTTDQQQRLSSLLAREIDLTLSLKKFLELEYKTLSKSDAAALEKIVTDKQEAISALELAGHQRDAEMSALGVSNTSATEVFGSNPHLAPLWSRLLSLATECQQQNRINGSVVELGMRHSIRALDILRGSIAADSNVDEFYDESGQKSSSAEKRSIAQA